MVELSISSYFNFIHKISILLWPLRGLTKVGKFILTICLNYNKKDVTKMDRIFWVQGSKVQASRGEASIVYASRIQASICPGSKCPKSKCPVIQSLRVQSPSVQSPTVQSPNVKSDRVRASSVQTPRVQASRPCTQSPDFPVWIAKGLKSLVMLFASDNLQLHHISWISKSLFTFTILQHFDARLWY